MTCNIKLDSNSIFTSFYFFQSHFCLPFLLRFIFFILVVALLCVPARWAHGFTFFPSLFCSPGMVLLLAAHKVRLPWDKGVTSQTPPEVVTLHCASEERGDANRVSPRACGESMFTARFRRGEFIHLSVWVTELFLQISHSVSASAGMWRSHIIHHKSKHCVW